MVVIQEYDGERRGVFSLYGILSVAFIFVLLIQLYRSITIDTYGLDQSRLDLVGFAVCHAIGIVLIFRSLTHQKIMADALLLCGILVTYVAIIVATTSVDTSLLAVLLSRYGILNWLLLGLGTAAAASYIHLPAGSPQARTQRRLFLLAAAIIGSLLTFFSLVYFSYPIYSPSYQAVANNLILILIVLMILTQIIWSGKVPVAVVIGLIAVGTLAVTATARMQSTSIVAFWIVGLIIYFWSALSKLSPKYKIFIFLVVAVITAAYISSDIFTNTLESTRFSKFLTGGGLSSIESRLDLLTDFGKQFSVSPIFGHFSAEVLAGSGSGNYPHSLLSFLTHTGLIGTSQLCLVLFLIYSRRLPLRRLGPSDLQQLLIMSAILALGTLSVFMTWPVLWFMLGFMCKKPIFRVPGEAK
jgi:hypothetical protein